MSPGNWIPKFQVGERNLFVMTDGVGDSISYTEAMDRRDAAVSSATNVQSMLSNGTNNMCTMGGISNNSDDAIEGPRKKKLRTSRREATTGPKYLNSSRAPQIYEAQQPRTKKLRTAPDQGPYLFAIWYRPPGEDPARISAFER